MTSVSSYIDSNTGKTIESSNIFPFKTHFMGVRMYVGLWNFRANLLNFQDNLTKFVETLPIDKSSLDVYLKVKDLLYRKNKKGQLEAEEEDYLASH
jgi:hypothetical protein